MHLYGYFYRNDFDLDKLYLNIDCKFYFFQLETNEILITFNQEQKLPFIIPGVFTLNRNHITNTLFTINALNRLLQEKFNTINSKHELDWQNYRKKLLTIKSNNLIINTLTLIHF